MNTLSASHVLFDAVIAETNSGLSLQSVELLVRLLLLKKLGIKGLGLPSASNTGWLIDHGPIATKKGISSLLDCDNELDHDFN